MCTETSGVPVPCAIRSPADLRRILQILQRAIATGTLQQLWPEDSRWVSEESVENLLDAGTWPDYVEMHFVESQTGGRYRLTAETYHGSGGWWERLE